MGRALLSIGCKKKTVIDLPLSDVHEAYNQFHIKESKRYASVSCPVVIVDYNPRWPSFFEKEKLCILSVAGNRILEVEHIGSTAVVGLGAKPIIDIIAGVSCSSVADELLVLLRKMGYKNVIRQLGHSEWYYCLKKVIHGQESWLQSFHLHLMKFRSDTWERHIRFRDFLRRSPKAMQKYDKMKRMLALKYGVDRESYTNAKTEFIASVVNQAKVKLS